MSIDTMCPDSSRLAQLVNGDLPEADLDTICDHVSACPACTTILRNLSDEQTVLNFGPLHTASWITDPDDRGVVEQLIARWRGLALQIEQNSSSLLQNASLSQNASTEGPRSCADDCPTEIPSKISFDELARQLLRSPASEAELGWLGPYRVLSVLGCGGMGVVFEAEDPRLGRRVAVKAMQPSLRGRQEYKLRFLREARAAASIDHDNIVPIHQVDEDRDVPFLVMPLLKGESLESRLRRAGKLSVAETLRIGRQITIGIAAAHDRGLIHRDIKPANIWLEDRGQQLQRVRILDFGLARIEDDESALTQTGSIAGTPAYMAPEQARGDLTDARSDLFSLGCVLYCMLAGHPPFSGRNSAATIFAIINHQPKLLSDISTHAPESLCLLVMQLLEKDPALRVQRADDVALALHRIEDQSSDQNSVNASDSCRPVNEPTSQHIESENANAALEPDRGGAVKLEVKRLISRHWMLGAAVTVALIAISVLIALNGILKVQTQYGTMILEFDSQAIDGAEVFVDEQQMIALKFPDGEPVTLAVDPGTHMLKVAKPGFEIFTREFKMASRGREVIHVRLEPQKPRGKTNAASGSAPDEAPQSYTLPGAAQGTRMTDIPFPGLVANPVQIAGHRKWQIETLAPRGDIFAVAWDQEGRHVACGSPIGNVRIIDVQSSKTSCIIPAHVGSVWAIDWSLTEDRIVTAGEDGAVRLFDSRGHLRQELGSHAGTARCVAFSRDGTWIASGGFDSKIRLWRKTGEPGPILSGHTSQIDGVAWHSSGKKLASASLDGTVRIWDLNEAWNTNGIRSLELKGHLGGVLGLSWSFDGELLASAGVDGTVLVWTSDGKQQSAFSGHGNAVTAINWSRNGLIATSGDDKTIRVWQRDGTLLKSQNLSVGRINDLTWSNDGSRLAIATDDQGIRFLNESGDWVGAISLDTVSMRAISYNSSGELATVGDGGFVGIWNADGTRKTEFKGYTRRVNSVNWNSDGNQLLTGNWDMSVRIWDADGDVTATRNGTNPTAWNPRGEELAWTSAADVQFEAPGSPVRMLHGHKSQVIRLVWNSSGSLLASADVNGEIRVWNRDGSPAGAIQTDPVVMALAWHPAKPLLATGTAANGNIQIWSLDGNLIKSWKAHSKGIIALDWNPTDDRLLSSAYDQHVRVWDEEANAVGNLAGPMAIACAATWNATGQQIATAHIDGTVRVWDGNTLQPISTSLIFNDGNWALVHSRGISSSSDPAAVDGRFVGMVEVEHGAVELIKPSNFQEWKVPATGN